MRVPVLMYHAVLPVERAADVRGTVPLVAFREQVAWLARRGFTSIDLARATEVVSSRGGAPRDEVPRRPVVITFDDGYRSVVDHALPVLAEAGFRATLFVVTGFVGGESHWYAHKHGLVFEHASWDELERAIAQGFEVGSHGVTHTRLSALSTEECDEELGRSREEVTARLGACAHFAYPFGDAPAPVVERVAKAGYTSACTTRRGFNRPGVSPFLLLRQTVSRTTDAARFRRRAGAFW